ncbi:MAG: ferredoxin reductase [Mycobacteriaceae bacterium]|nr:ferredoxin reductase [Mycobacteriaceae bacterium]
MVRRSGAAVPRGAPVKIPPRTAGLLRRVAAQVTTPLLPDDYLHLVNPLWTERELRGRIVSVRRETEDAATLVIKPGWGFDFDYRPGQYLGIGVRVDGRWHWRSYSLTSPPSRRAGVVTVTVKAMPEGFLSSHLVAGVPAGTVVRLASPAGDFQLPDPPPGKVLFLTAGSGVTPVLAMLRTLDRRGDFAGADVLHVHCAPTAAEVMFADELDRLSRRRANYRLRLRLTREQGRLAPADLDELVPDWRERHTWACGPGGLLDELQHHWRAAGLAERLHLERFALTRTAHGEGGEVTFRQSDRAATVDGATTLLQAGEQLGVAMPFGCRMGICRTCVVPLVDGNAVDLRTGETHTAGERIRTCVTAPTGPCTLDC